VLTLILVFASRALFTRKTFEESEVCPVSGGENRDAAGGQNPHPRARVELLAIPQADFIKRYL
jgi:hypothetical protein